MIRIALTPLLGGDRRGSHPTSVAMPRDMPIGCTPTCQVAFWKKNPGRTIMDTADAPPPTRPPQTPPELRAFAARVRRHARNLLSDEAVPRLLAFAEELDARADAIEHGLH